MNNALNEIPLYNAEQDSIDVFNEENFEMSEPEKVIRSRFKYATDSYEIEGEVMEHLAEHGSMDVLYYTADDCNGWREFAHDMREQFGSEWLDEFERLIR